MINLPAKSTPSWRALAVGLSQCLPTSATNFPNDAVPCPEMIFSRHNQRSVHEPEVDCCHSGDRWRAHICSGSKSAGCEGDQGRCTKRLQNYQQRQDQEPGLL